MTGIVAAVVAKLKEIHPRVYSEETEFDDKAYPYITYDPGDLSGADEYMDNCFFDIDGWSNDPDSTVIDSLMKSIDDAVNGEPIMVESYCITLFTENKMRIKEKNKKIKHRRYVYRALIYERS